MRRFIGVEPKNRTDMEVLVPRLLIMAGEQTERAGDLSIFSKFDLNVSRFSLLMVLMRASRPLSMTEVKDFMVRSPSNLTQMVDNLEQRKLVRRIPREGDRRVNVLELTTEGRKLLGQVQQVFSQTMKDFFDGKSSEELEDMVAALTEIIQGMFKLQGLEPPSLGES